jgi:putative spermidine/putrescine transport system permease protein
MKELLATARWLYLIAIYVFIVGPMLFVCAASLNSAANFPATFAGISFKWYQAILNYPEFTRAAWISALVAMVSSVIAVVAAFLAGYGMFRSDRKESVALSTILASPILVPQIVLSLATLQFLALFGISSGFAGLIAVHTVHNLPFALRLVLSGFSRYNFSLEEASLGLGASRLTTWRQVTVPILKANLIAGFTFCFILSFVNLPISLFLTDARTATLPLVMFAHLEARIDPMLPAVASIIVIAAAATTILLERYLRIRLVD